MPVYPEGPEGLYAQWDARRSPLRPGPGEVLPKPGSDLSALVTTRVPHDLPPLPPGASRHAKKEREIAPEFAGQPALFLLHGLVIAHLRKRSFPRRAPALFRQIWVDHAELLLTLPTRWLISAAVTFGDHGATEGERVLGRELGMLFALMKLYEFERLLSGTTGDRPWPLRRGAGRMPMGMETFSVMSGGLDVNLLAPLWQRAAGEEVLGPLALTLLDRLNEDGGTIFARLQAMRGGAPGRDGSKP